MQHVFLRCLPGTMLLAIAFWVAVASTAIASPIWERSGPFQACLEAQFKEWVDQRAELVVNDDPAASQVDDAAVAKWTIAALEACRSRVGGGDADSEARFTKHMASWREHIYNLAQSILRRSGGPD